MKRFVGIEELFTHKLGMRNFELTLIKETLSDGSHFFWLKDAYGMVKVEYASKYINDLIKQLEHEKKVIINSAVVNSYDGDEEYQNRVSKVIEWKDLIINDMKKYAN